MKQLMFLHKFLNYKILINTVIFVFIATNLFPLAPQSNITKDINQTLIANELDYWIHEGTIKEKEIASQLNKYLLSDNRKYHQATFPETSVLAPSDLKRLQTDSPHLHWKNAASIHWGELVRTPWKQTSKDILFDELEELQSLKNQHNYSLNQEAVRKSFLLFLKELSIGKSVSIKDIEDLMINLHTILLLGEDNKTFYFPINLLNVQNGKIDIQQLQDYAKNLNPQVSSLNFRFQIFLNFLNELVKEETTQEQTINIVADIYELFIRIKANPGINPNDLYLFKVGNNSLFMNMINTILKLKGLNEFSHGHIEFPDLLPQIKFKKLISLFAYKKATSHEVIKELIDIISLSNKSTAFYYRLFDHIVYQFELGLPAVSYLNRNITESSS